MTGSSGNHKKVINVDTSILGVDLWSRNSYWKACRRCKACAPNPGNSVSKETG